MAGPKGLRGPVGQTGAAGPAGPEVKTTAYSNCLVNKTHYFCLDQTVEF